MTRTFRPRLTRRVIIGLATLSVIALIVLFAVVPTSGLFSFGIEDYVAGIVFLGMILYILYLHYQVRVDVHDDGITVKNLINTHRYSWAQLVDVEFGSGPWARLDISDGTTTAVMAIQSADGDYGRREAVRLATLIDQHSPTRD